MSACWTSAVRAIDPRRVPSKPFAANSAAAASRMRRLVSTALRSFFRGEAAAGSRFSSIVRASSPEPRPERPSGDVREETEGFCIERSERGRRAFRRTADCGAPSRVAGSRELCGGSSFAVMTSLLTGGTALSLFARGGAARSVVLASFVASAGATLSLGAMAGRGTLRDVVVRPSFTGFSCVAHEPARSRMLVCTRIVTRESTPAKGAPWRVVGRESESGRTRVAGEGASRWASATFRHWAPRSRIRSRRALRSPSLRAASAGRAASRSGRSC